MNKLATAAVAASLAVSGSAYSQEVRSRRDVSQEDIRAVSPALENYTENRLLGEVWKRPGLSRRDRSIVTIATLVARNQAIEMPFYFGMALDNGVKPAELSEIITHLALYAGWPNAMSAVAAVKEVFAARGIRADQLPAVTPEPLPLDEAAEATRAKRVQEDVGPVSQGVVDYTDDLLFNDIWRRPDLAPRDRSLVTVSALIANGQAGQITYHLNRALDNGLSKAEASEVLTHISFYSGWPTVFSAIPVFKEVLAKRAG